MREEIIGSCRLILGDCCTVDLPKDAAIVSDPPYGIGYSKGPGGSRVTGRRLCASRFVEPIIGDDVPFDPSPWVGFGEVILWGADHFKCRLPNGGRFLAWDKKSGWSFEDDFSDVEFAWHSERGAARVINYLWKGVRQAGEKGAPKYHPTQKPVAVMEWCIKQLKRQADLIIDPYMGSGTTGIAAVKAGRRFIGIEIDERHFETACKRIRAAVAQPDLFVSPPSPPVQLSLME